MSYSTMHKHYGNHLSTRNVRRVWAQVSQTPHASHRELAQALNLSHGAISSALRLLKDAGYVQFPKCASRAVEVIVPFIVQEQQ